MTLNAEAIFFPDLSLTGYEPALAKKLATKKNENSLDIFQQICNNNQIIIGLGLPTSRESQIRISMVIFEANKPRQTYSKQQLHSDEFPYFENGVGQVIIKTKDKNIASAIFYESLQPTYSDKLGADVYLAIVAKPANGVEKDFDHYPKVAKQYRIFLFFLQ